MLLLCCGCHRSSSYDPFLDLSVPIHRDCDAPSSSSRSGGGGGGGGGRSGMGLFSALKVTSTSYINSESNNSTLEKCLTKFTGETGFILFAFIMTQFVSIVAVQFTEFYYFI